MNINKRKAIALLTAGLLAIESILVLQDLSGNDSVLAASDGVKFGTPVLDGVMDDIYSGSALLNTIDFAKNGQLSLGMPSFSSSKAAAYVSAGIISSASSTTLKPSGNYNISAFPKAEIRFLWDREAIYIFSKIYDSDILVPSQSTLNSLNGDSPWLTDSINNIIYADGNPYAQINVYGLAGGGACWDNISAQTTDRRPGGWTTIGYFNGASLQQKESNRKHVASVVNSADGYYTVEMKIPFSNAEFDGTTIRDAILKPGGKFEYRFWLTDGENGLQSNGYHGNNFAIYISDVGTTFTLIGCQNSSDHVWGGYVTDVEPTCTKAGRESIHCEICDTPDISTSRLLAKTEHTFVITEIAADCTIPAMTESKCSSCGYTVLSETAPALGHDYINGACIRCGDSDPLFAPSLTAESAVGYIGDTVEMSLILSNTAEIRSMIVYDFVYDETALTLQSAEWCVDGAVISDYDPAENAAVLALEKNTDINGAVLNLTFAVADNAQVGNYTVSAAAAAKTKPAAGSETDVVLLFKEGAITVSTGVKYDMNGDGTLDSDDAVYLLRSLYMPDDFVLPQSGDVNEDGVFDSDDAVWLLEYSFT